VGPNQGIRAVRSPFAPAGTAALVLVVSAIRWHLQGSGNLYTSFEKRFYVPDADLGWHISNQHPIWIGLDACAAIVVLALVLTVVGVITRRRENRRQTRASGFRVVAWGMAIASAGIPAVAFLSGPGPLHARDTLPAVDAVLIEDGIAGSLDAPEGQYVVVKHGGTAVTAHLSAGGEVFDARFADITGVWNGAPRDLARPIHAEIGVAAASVDTGIGERTKHAREGYLHADKFPRITVTLERVAAARTDETHGVAFRAPGAVSLLGKTQAVEITGTVAKLDPSALARLGLAGVILLVRADLTLPIRDTALAPHSGDFDSDTIPVHVSLLLRHTSR